MPRKPPLANERPEELKLKNAPKSDWFPGNRPPTRLSERAGSLPVHPSTSKCVHARMLSVHAVIAVVPDSGEIRMPYVRRKDKGDFAPFMDALVTKLGNHPVRFTNVFMEDTAAAEAYDTLGDYLSAVAPDMNDIQSVDEKIRLEDALDGFDHETEHWGEYGSDVDTLVGNWDPERERENEQQP